MDNTFISLFDFLISLEFITFVFIAIMINSSIIFVPQNSVSVVERFQKFQSNRESGLNFVFPFIDKVVVNRSLKEQLIHIPTQSALTKDNINVAAQGILHFKIVNPYKTTYSIEDYIFSLTQLAHATFRLELSKIELNNTFENPEYLNINIIDSLNDATKTWGILILGYEIKEISLPASILQEMEGHMRMNMRAEQEKQALIIESEGKKQSAINIAEGKKQALILAAEANKFERSLKIETHYSDVADNNNVEEIFAQSL